MSEEKVNEVSKEEEALIQLKMRIEGLSHRLFVKKTSLELEAEVVDCYRKQMDSWGALAMSCMPEQGEALISEFDGWIDHHAVWELTG